MMKDFRIREWLKAQYRCEVFNLTNTPFFGLPTALSLTYNTPTFGRITAGRRSAGDSDGSEVDLLTFGSETIFQPKLQLPRVNRR